MLRSLLRVSVYRPFAKRTAMHKEMDIMLCYIQKITHAVIIIKHCLILSILLVTTKLYNATNLDKYGEHTQCST